MAKNNHLSIQEAADLSKKSIQTIRRAIKAKKLKCKKKKTPQGFNYLISQESLSELYKIEIPEKEEKVIPSKKKDNAKKSEKPTSKKKKKSMLVKSNDFKSFAETMEKFLMQHSEERQNFLRLINTLQERIFVLENQLNLLKEPEQNKSWYQFWK